MVPLTFIKQCVVARMLTTCWQMVWHRLLCTLWRFLAF